MEDFSSHQMKATDREKISQLPGNNRCVDCGKANPEWASITLGVLLCLECSGPHRGMGTHISRVRSLAMDSWSEPQLKYMFLGGNTQCKTFLTGHGITWENTPAVKDRYDSPPAELYRRVLKARVDGTPEPTELPEPEATEPVQDRPMAGFGSGPDPRQLKKRTSKRKKLVALGVGVGSIALAGWMALSKKGKMKNKMSRGV